MPATFKNPCGSLRPLFLLNQEESASSSNFSLSGGISLVSNSSSRGIGVSNFSSSANSCRCRTLRQEESALETKYGVSRIRAEPDKNVVVLRRRRWRTLVFVELLSSSHLSLSHSWRRTCRRRTIGVGELLSLYSSSTIRCDNFRRNPT